MIKNENETPEGGHFRPVALGHMFQNVVGGRSADPHACRGIPAYKDLPQKDRNYLNSFMSRFDTAKHDPKDYQENKPKIAIIMCADSRMMAGPLFDAKVGEVFIHKPVGGVVPERGKTDFDLISFMALCRLKGVKNFLLLGHEDCGAAGIAYKNRPLPDDIVEWTDNDIITGNIARTGIDVRGLSGVFQKVTNGDDHAGIDLLGRSVLVRSLQNLMPFLEDGIRSGVYNVAAAYVHMGPKADRIAIDVYDLDRHQFTPYDPLAANKQPSSHMCQRNNDCTNCSCEKQVEYSLGVTENDIERLRARISFLPMHEQGKPLVFGE